MKVSYQVIKSEFKEFYEVNGVDNFIGVLIIFFGIILFVVKLLYFPADSMNSGFVSKFLIPFFGSFGLSAVIVASVGGLLYGAFMIWAYLYRNGKLR